MEIYNFTNDAPLTQEDAEQMAKAIEAFKNGEKQPEGRFTIIKTLKKNNEE